jgi:hypothetical protein
MYRNNTYHRKWNQLNTDAFPILRIERKYEGNRLEKYKLEKREPTC